MSSIPSVTAISLLLFGGVTLAGAASAHHVNFHGPEGGTLPEEAAERAAPPQRLLGGLRNAPRLPLAHDILSLPNHPHGGPPGRADATESEEEAKKPVRERCDKDIDTSPHNGIVHVAAQNNGICTNADIDVYQRGGRTFVVQAGGQDAAWTLTEVTDPANPVMLEQATWDRSDTYTPDIKAFRQGFNDYIVMGLERMTFAASCGVVIVDVSAVPAGGSSSLVSQFIGNGWCDVHNVFVEDDSTGDGAFVYATANNTADLRVLDIGDVANPVEIGTYQRQIRGFFSSGTYDDIYVHDVTVVDGTVYASYWLGGLDIFDADLIKPGTIDETHPDVATIDPAAFGSGDPFLVHHAFPASGLTRVFMQDEITTTAGDNPVRLYDVGNPEVAQDSLTLGNGGVPVIPTHNLEIRHDLDFDGDGLADPDVVHLGWYKAGLQSWQFDGTGFTGLGPFLAHQVQTEGNDNLYDGAWGVRLARLGAVDQEAVYAFQSDRRYGLIIGCIEASGTCAGGTGDPGDPPPPEDGTAVVEGTVKDQNGRGVRSASVTITTAPSGEDTTKGNGRYTFDGVSAGTYDVTASKTGCNTVIEEVTVQSGTVTQDYVLACN